MCPVFLIERMIGFIVKYRDMVVIFASFATIVASITAVCTLWFNFCKDSKIKICIGKRYFIICFDTIFKSFSIDVVVTVLNENGAKSILVEGFRLKLFYCDKEISGLNYVDSLFLKFLPGTTKLTPDTYAHPIFLQKNSEKNITIGFSTKNSEYEFRKGCYRVLIEAYSNNNALARDEFYFELTDENIKHLIRNKNDGGSGLEVVIK